jgi:MinD-like ATPase involved in chromosome partitioning or flagellar assembly
MLKSLVRSIQASKNQKEISPQLIAVTSPHGSTGKTTVAINIALELATQKYKVLIIDADLAGSSVANYFCLSELPAGLVGAIRIASQNRFDAAQLDRLSIQLPKTSLTLLPGAMSKVTVELTNQILSAIVDTAKQSYEFVVVDLGAISPHSPKEEFDFTRSLIKLADQVVLVASADPVGIFRLLAVEASVLELAEQPKLVVNRLRNSVIAQAKIEIKSTLSKLGAIEVLAFFPDDPVHVDQATRVGMGSSGLGKSGSFKSAVEIFTRSAILGRQGALDARLAKLV